MPPPPQNKIPTDTELKSSKAFITVVDCEI